MTDYEAFKVTELYARFKKNLEGGGFECVICENCPENYVCNVEYKKCLPCNPPFSIINGKCVEECPGNFNQFIF